MTTLIFDTLPAQLTQARFADIASFLVYIQDQNIVTEIWELDIADITPEIQDAYQNSLVSSTSTRTNI
jgi:hypothetical protein